MRPCQKAGSAGGVDRQIDDPGANACRFLGPEAKPVQRADAAVFHIDIGPRDQRLQPRVLIGVPQIDKGRPHAHVDIEDQRLIPKVRSRAMGKTSAPYSASLRAETVPR